MRGRERESVIECDSDRVTARETKREREREREGARERSMMECDGLIVHLTISATA